MAIESFNSRRKSLFLAGLQASAALSHKRHSEIFYSTEGDLDDPLSEVSWLIRASTVGIAGWVFGTVGTLGIPFAVREIRSLSGKRRQSKKRTLN